MSALLHNLKGNKFGKLEVLERSSLNTNGGKPQWKCKCDCGNVIDIPATALKRKRGPKESCGCEMRYIKGKGSRSIAWKGIGEISSSWWYNHVLSSVNREKNRRRNIKVNITIEDGWKLFLTQNRRCSLSGVELTFSEDKSNTASLDRIDSLGDYEIGNVQWVHKDVNYMKQSFSQGYFIEMCRQISSFMVE